MPWNWVRKIALSEFPLNLLNMSCLLEIFSAQILKAVITWFVGQPLITELPKQRPYNTGWRTKNRPLLEQKKNEKRVLW